MHEMSITQGIIELCTEHAGGRRVVSVTLEIGELSGVVPEAVEFCFEACSSGTLLEGSRLEIIRSAGTGRCLACSREFQRSSLFEPCPDCGAYRIEQLSGEELRVREIEVED